MQLGSVMSIPALRKEMKKLADKFAMVEAIEKAQLLASQSQQEQYETATDVLVFLSLTGLRQSEARGVIRSDWDEKKSRC